MKKTVRVNISGFMFNIDEDAYNQLRHYLDDINNRFLDTEEGKEVIADVEARIAEIFQQRTSETKEVINVSDVDHIISILGRPEDFVSLGQEENEPRQERYHSHRPRRLYRDPDNRVVGGVCSGLGHYFGLDPLVFRILFVVTFFGWGTGVLVYLIFWIAVPSAMTTAQKLEMRGEPVTLGTIEKSIKEEFQGVKSSFERMSNGKAGERLRNSGQVAANAAGTFANVFLRFAVVFLGAVLILVGLSFLIGILTAAFVGNTIHVDQLHTSLFGLLNLVTDSSLASWIVVCTLILVIIPVVFLIYLGLKMIFRFNFGSRVIGLSALGIWFITLGVTVFFSIKLGSQFAYSETVSTHKLLDSLKSDTLYVGSFLPGNIAPLLDEDGEERNYRHNDVRLDESNGQLALYLSPYVTVEKGETNQFEVIMNVTARGKDRETARKFAQNVKYQWQQKDSLLEFSKYFVMNATDKFQGQKVKIRIKVPVGKVVHLNNSAKHVIYDIENVEDMWDGDMIDKKWIMRPYGLTEFKTKQMEKEIKKELEATKDEVNRMKEELKEMKNNR